MARPSRVVAVLALVLALFGCTRSKPQGNLPAGDQLLKDCAAAMRDVKTARFVIEAEATIADVPVRGADAQLTREGSAKGAIRIDQGGGIVEFQFVIIGQKLWLKGPTGSFQELPLAMASGIYDPSAILDPERGVAKLLSTATEAKTQARESVDGVDAYRVSAKFDPAAVAALVPGAGEGVTGRVWVGVERKLPVRMTFSLPAQGGGKPGTVTVKFSEYDAPVTINAP